MRNDLEKDFQKFPNGLRTLFFSLFDWLSSYGFKAERSRRRDGNPGNTVKFVLNGRQVCSVQISPAEDLHLHFNKEVFESNNLLDKLEEVLYRNIIPHVIGDDKGTANEKTKTGLKLILTENDASIAELIKKHLMPLFKLLIEK